MNTSFITRVLIPGLVLIGSSLVSSAQTFAWKPVRVGGGGAVTTFQAHPQVQNLYFITTDVGTPYKWNATQQRWEGLFYKTTPSTWSNRNAAARIAFVPSDTTGNILYATTGGPWAVDGTVLKSTDRGNTWSDCAILLDVKPNKEQGAGQRLAVDPLNSNVVYVTTRSSATVTATNGTFRTTTAGAPGSWTKINDLYGTFVQFDVSGGTVSGVTKNIFIGCAAGVYRSTDGGANFTLMSGSPANVNRASIHASGTLYVTAATGVYKWNGTAWSNITPPATSGNYSAVAVNPNNASQVVVSSSSWDPYVFNHYRTGNAGAGWESMGKVHDKTEAPWFATTIGQATGEFCWDPYNQTKVWFTDFFFAYETANVWSATNVTWKSRPAGHEESVTIGNLLCPPSSTNGTNVLHSSVADIGGWDHKSLTAPPAVGMMTFFPWIGVQTPSGWGGWGNMTGVAVQETNPAFIARVGRVAWDGPGYAGYSTDGGANYTKWTSPANAAGGRIAVAANSQTMVWVTQQNASYRSTNLGVTWTPIATLPSGIIIGGNDVFSTGSRFPLAADKVDGNKFYVYHNSRMYVSADAGVTFTAAATLPYSWPQNALTVETTPGIAGDLWVAMQLDYDGGLHHSTNSGTSFTRITAVQNARFFAIGKAAPTSPTVPALYVYGTVNNIANSLFRSNDNGVTWTNLGAPNIGTAPFAMSADRQTYGRVYFGTTGNGIMVGELAIPAVAKIVNAANGKSLRPYNAGTTNNVNIVQYAYNAGWTSQQWQVNDLGNGYYSIINVYTGKSLRPYNAGTTSGTSIVQDAYDPTWTSEQWELIPDGTGGYGIKNRYTALALRPLNSGTGDDVQIIQETYNSSTANMKWQIAAP